MIYVVRHLMHHAAVPLDNGEGIKIVEILVVAVYKSDSERLFFQISQRYASFFHKVVDKAEISANNERITARDLLHLRVLESI